MSAIAIAVAAPFAGAVIATAVRYRPVRRPLRAAFSAIAVVLGFIALPQVDRLSGLFIVIISLLSLMATVYSLSIFPGSQDEAAPWSSRPVYCILLGAFTSSMLAAVTSTTFIGLWIGISATTLATTFLVGFSGGKSALEAAWKYLMLCSFGIAIALIGILLLGRAGLAAHVPAAAALSWDALATNGDRLSPALTRVALLLMLLGFGTKAGLVPMHSWLPDAHSKAPAPISALLSGLLVSCALYALVRVGHVAAAAAPTLFNDVLLCVGSVSMLVAATLMLAQRDIKRLLSYSTVEHAGLVAIALGLGTPLGAFAAIYHIVNHAFAKSLAFFAVGIVQHERGTTTIGKLHGLWSDPSGKLLLAAFIALTGLPPFGIFLSELLIVLAAAAAHAWAALLCALTGLLVAFIALARLAIDTECGSGSVRPPNERWPILAFVSTGGAAVAAALLVLVPFLPFVARDSALAVALGPR
jgi:hydrogenase-4 component F